MIQLTPFFRRLGLAACLFTGLLASPRLEAADEPAAPATPPPLPEKRVYVPYSELQSMLKDQGQGVFLPYREFIDLWNQLTEKKKEETIAPPADALLASAEYTGTVREGVAEIEAILKVQSFKEKGWATLLLGAKGLSIASAETGEATLRSTDKGFEVLLPKKGAYDLKLKIFSRLQDSAGRRSLQFSPPLTAVSRLTLNIPGQGYDFTTKPAAAFTAQPTGEATTFSAFFGQLDSLEVAWQKQGEESKLTPLLFADTTTDVTLSPGALRSEVKVGLTILRAGVSQFDIAVPAPHQVLNVSAPNLKEWTLSPSADPAAPGDVLHLALHAPARNELALTLTLETAVDALPASLTLPSLTVSGTTRQRGQFLIKAAPELDLQPASPVNLTQQPLDPGTAAHSSWRYLKTPYSLALNVTRALPLVETSSLTRVSLDTDLLQFTTTFDYTIKRAGLFSTRLLVPDGIDSLDATGDAVDSFTTAVTDGKKFLTIKFKRETTERTSFTLTGRQTRPTPETKAVLPLFQPQDVSRHEASVSVALDPALDATTSELGSFKQIDLSELPGQQLKQEPATQQVVVQPVAVPTLAFRYRAADTTPATLSLKTRKPQTSGEVLTLVELKEQSVTYHWWINYQILYSGIDSVVISLPRDIAADLRLETRSIKETDKAWKPTPAPAADSQRDYWRLTPRDKWRGSQQLEFTLERPLPALEPGKATPLAVPELQLHDLFQETGQIAVIKQGTLELLDPEKSPTLEIIDPAELHDPLTRTGVIFSAKYRNHPVTLTLPVSRNVPLPVPQSVVTYADLTSVLSTDRTLTTEVIYFVRNNTQQFFTVRLPAGARIISDLNVAGTSQQPTRRPDAADDRELLIRLPAAGSQPPDFPVRFLYETRPEKTAQLGDSATLTLEACQLLEAAILQTRHTLYLPGGFAWHDFTGPLTPPVQARGWARHRGKFAWLIPALGPLIPESRQTTWPSPPPIEAKVRASYDVPLTRDGLAFPLHRLDSPAAITVSCRSLRFEYTLEALAALLGLVGGLLLLRASLRAKMLYLLVIGGGALIAEGFLPTSYSAPLKYLYLGVLLAVPCWIVCAIIRKINKSAADQSTKPEPPTPPAPAPKKAEPEPEPAPAAPAPEPEKPAPLFTDAPPPEPPDSPTLPPFPNS